MKDNFYIKILEFGKDHLKGFNYEEIKEGLKEKLGRDLKEWEDFILEKYLRRASENEVSYKEPYKETIFLCKSFGGDFNNHNVKYIISPESYFKYIDYVELREARKYSRESLKYAEKSLQKAEKSLQKTKTAIKISIWALVFSIIFSIISIYLSMKQIKTPIKINEKQFNQIIENKK